ncbi:MAG: SRPBCC family protein [Anaerolineae bacterium]|nr:SRPBCC family protein [Anaerolineae bacterium]
MAALIVEQILIPASSDAVWSVIADQEQLPRWRQDCQRVSLLSTRQFGVGTRRRCIPPRGKDRVEEITAWYEGLGYEYALIESREYQNWVGRLRLQPVPEGTIVQWTINYQPRGLMGTLRHALGKNARSTR